MEGFVIAEKGARGRPEESQKTNDLARLNGTGEQRKE